MDATSLKGTTTPSVDKIVDYKTDVENAQNSTHDFSQGYVGDYAAPANFSEVDEMRQGLKSRHLQMMALAGAIGTGLFLGSGKAIANAGPVGALLGYTLIGFAGAAVVLAVAEMAALVPLSGGVVRYAEIFVDPSLSFANGWNLVYKGLIFIPTELVAAGVLLEYWTDTSTAVWIVVFGFLMALSNSLPVKYFGELESFFALLKIALIIVINIMAIVIISGGAPNHHVLGFTYWIDPGPFVQRFGISGALGRFLGFYTTFNSALYAYSGIEGISLVAAETQNPRQSIPQAAKKVFWRILCFYVITIFLVGLIIPSTNKELLTSSGAAASPFVIAANLSGIKVIPHVINAVVITSAWSSGNAGMVNYVRYLYGMARNGHAPKVFTRLNRFGVPYCAVLLFTLFMALTFLSLSKGASAAFSWLQDLLSTAVLVNWTVILITYLRFFYGCQKQGIDRKELPFRAPFQPYFTWVSLSIFILLIFTSGYSTFISGHWSTETFISSYFNPVFVLVLYFGHKFVRKNKIIPLSQIPIRPLLDIAHADPGVPAPKRKGWGKLNVLW
ncbi:amino acid permease/ SLC12A domain-containing protein [Xylaria arbuscula]|nr:amino acid permease/ SLC12A domain-containing protein [Xylaria arbuscula]